MTIVMNESPVPEKYRVIIREREPFVNQCDRDVRFSSLLSQVYDLANSVFLGTNLPGFVSHQFSLYQQGAVLYVHSEMKVRDPKIRPNEILVTIELPEHGRRPATWATQFKMTRDDNVYSLKEFYINRGWIDMSSDLVWNIMEHMRAVLHGKVSDMHRRGLPVFPIDPKLKRKAALRLFNYLSRHGALETELGRQASTWLKETRV